MFSAGNLLLLNLPSSGKGSFLFRYKIDQQGRYWFQFLQKAYLFPNQFLIFRPHTIYCHLPFSRLCVQRAVQTESRTSPPHLEVIISSLLILPSFPLHCQFVVYSTNYVKELKKISVVVWAARIADIFSSLFIKFILSLLLTYKYFIT